MLDRHQGRSTRARKVALVSRGEGQGISSYNYEDEAFQRADRPSADETATDIPEDPGE